MGASVMMRGLRLLLPEEAGKIKGMTGIPRSPWPRIIGFALVAAGLLSTFLESGPFLGNWGATLAFPGAALLCGGWEFWEIRRREARSRKFDGEAHGVIVKSRIGPGYADTSPIMEMMVSFTDGNGIKRRAFVRSVVALNELPAYGVGRPVLVRYAIAAPDTDLVIEPVGRIIS